MNVRVYAQKENGKEHVCGIPCNDYLKQMLNIDILKYYKNSSSTSSVVSVWACS